MELTLTNLTIEVKGFSLTSIIHPGILAQWTLCVDSASADVVSRDQFKRTWLARSLCTAKERTVHCSLHIPLACVQPAALVQRAAVHRLTFLIPRHPYTPGNYIDTTVLLENTPLVKFRHVKVLPYPHC